MKKRLLSLALGLVVCVLPITKIMAENYKAYLFTYFTGNEISQEAVHYAISTDGYNYWALNDNKPVINSKEISSTGGVRDPHILRCEDGKTFYMVLTDMVSRKGWDSNRAMILLKSSDLVNWTHSVINIQKRYKGQENLKRVWAPQTIYDKDRKKYMVYWSMKHGNGPDIIYYAYANKSFTDLEGEPKPLFLPSDGKSCIDGDIIYKDGMYHLFYKTEGHGNGIKVAVTKSLTSGQWTEDNEYKQQTKEDVEGAGTFKLIDQDKYILMYDVYKKGAYQFTETTDLKNFKVIDHEVSMNFHPRHGTIIPITGKELERLVSRWGSAIPEGHPRYYTSESDKKETLNLIKKEKWAKDVFDGLTSRVEKYSSKGPEWLSSRLQMYWNTHSTDVYIKGEYYDHAGGEKAPAPTVMYNGSRGSSTVYRRPKLEDIEPYAEDRRGMYLANTSLKGEPMEWAPISKTGRIVESINKEIIGIACDAAFLWWLTGKEEYASMAASVFDTYMTGIYYRNVPIDLNHGHQQTLVGMTTFEVIHEAIIKTLVPLYDFLYPYLYKTRPEKIQIYASAFKKWAENIIANGVPHNNWNLMQARFVMDIALILEDNSLYADGKGREYYIDYIINRSSIRQWSLKQLAEYGYDSNTGIWAECPGYSSVVVGDYAQFVSLFDRNLGRDLTKDIPVISKAVSAMPQYLFPNMMQVGFGDTHPSYLRTDIFKYMVANAQQHGKKDEEEHFTRMLKLFDPNAEKLSDGQARMPVAVSSFFSDKPLKLNSKTKAGTIDDYVTPSFYSPNVSWLVQRNGMNRENSLMISLNGSDGNHMHANGISMELYGKGYPLAPDAGIGTMGYSGLDYLEYYSQFPSHNTVCVDGISSYPVMKSNHAFKLKNMYPASAAKVPYQPVSYSEVYFREPESYSDQTRLNGIINTSDSTGYYVDIFRSKKVEGGDKMHDYFYHNMGQVMTLKAADGTNLNLQPTQELAFAGAHLYAYSYIYDKKSAKTDKNIKAEYTINMPDKNDITMNMWMKGETDREVFSALSPMTEGVSRIKDMPYDIKKQPTLTFVARQKGEAWTRPFVSIFEPVTKSSPSAISSVEYPSVKSEGGSGSNVAVKVNLKNGNCDLILSSDANSYLCSSEDAETKSTYSICRTKECSPVLVFMGNGTYYKCGTMEIKASVPGDVLVYIENGKWKCTSSSDAVVTLGGVSHEVKAGEGEVILK